jgi:signal transduction histidine kinase
LRVAARQVRLTVAVASLSALVTLLWTVTPGVRFAYRGASMHVALETSASLIALVAAYLVFWRFRRHGRAGDLALFGALAVLAGTNLLFSALPAALGHATETLPTWAQAGGRLLGAVALVGAAFAPDTMVRRPGRAAAGAILAAAALLALLAATLALLESSLPQAIDPALSPEASGRPRIVGHPSILALQAVATLLYAAAAVGFTRMARRRRDELMAWLAVASTLGAFARLNYFLFPSLYSDWVYTGDLFRLGSFVVLLLGAFREIQGHQNELVEAAELRERRRVARALHDGLAHELAFVVTQSRRLAGGPHDELALRHLSAAAERALDESRDAIAALGRPADGPLGAVVAQAALEVAARFDIDLRLDVADSGDVCPETREQLIRIVREAVTNAARHGAARTVIVELRRNDVLRLQIVDDGVGFDPSAPRLGRRGFGLTSMRERAGAAGGVLHIASQPGEGTQIEVVLP